MKKRENLSKYTVKMVENSWCHYFNSWYSFFLISYPDFETDFSLNTDFSYFIVRKYSFFPSPFCWGIDFRKNVPLRGMNSFLLPGRWRVKMPRVKNVFFIKLESLHQPWWNTQVSQKIQQIFWRDKALMSQEKCDMMYPWS